MRINQKFLKILNILIFISTISLFIYVETGDIQHLAVKNRFTEIDSRVPGGIKFSINEGLDSYGMFDVGYDTLDPKYTSFSLELNLYDKVEKINVDFLEKNKTETINYINSYKKLSGLYPRILPYLIYKFTSLFSDKFIFVQILYTVLSTISFLFLFFKIQKKYSFLTSSIFYLLFVTNPFLITYISSFIAPLFVSLIPLACLSSYKVRNKVIKSKSSIIIFFILLFPSLISNTQGPIIFLSFITGLKLFEDNFSLIKNKVLVIKSFLISMFLILFGELLWILQRIFLLKEDTSFVFGELVGSVGKYNIFNQVLTSDYKLESCSNISNYEFVNLFLNLKINDFLFFEVYLKHYLLLLSALFVLNKIKAEHDIKLDFQFIFFNLATYFVWFFIIKGAFACHIHVYPRYLLLAFIPSIFIYIKKNHIIET